MRAMYCRMGLPKPQSGLLFDAAKSSDWQIPLRMRDGDPAAFCRMLELDMASLLGHPEPAVGFQQSDQSSTVHVYLYTLHRNVNLIRGAPQLGLWRTKRNLP